MIAAVVEPVGRNANWSLYCSCIEILANDIKVDTTDTTDQYMLYSRELQGIHIGQH